VTKLKTTLIIVVAGVFFLGSLFLYLRSGEDDYEEEELRGRIYRNEDFGYEMSYPTGWEVREKRDLSFFHPAIDNKDFLRMGVDLDNYIEISGISLVGSSPLTYIDGTIDYNIEQSAYFNKDALTVRQWYDIAVLMEAYHTQKIGEADFVRMRNTIIGEGEIKEERGRVFDPWISRGSSIKVGRKEVLKTTWAGGHRYDGFQYYITSIDDYIFVFYFGYGGTVTPREMWQRSDRHVKEMINSLRVF